MQSAVSIIIPALNEACVIERAVREARAQKPFEIIVVDGGSTDGTAELAARSGARVLAAPKGRAVQMNAASRVAEGDILLFLHADTVLPDDALRLVRRSLETEGAVGGRFRVRFDDPSPRYRLLAFTTRFSFFSYGDQAFFVKRNVFQSLAGYDPSVPFEDIDFFKRLRCAGRIRILDATVTTSARRFRKTGFLKQRCVNFLLASLALAGANPRRLIKRWYPDVR